MMAQSVSFSIGFHLLKSPPSLSRSDSRRRLMISMQKKPNDECKREASSDLKASHLLRAAEQLLSTESSDKHEPLEGTSRRMVFSSAMIGLGLALGKSDPVNAFRSDSLSTNKFQWQTTPYNKRTGVTAYDAEGAGYNIRFVTYLSRFLLCFDPDCQLWWYNRARDLPFKATNEEVQAKRLEQFGAFSASVEVGLIGYSGSDGPVKLMQNLLRRYSLDLETVKQQRTAQGLAPLTEAEEKRRERETRSARRHIALLFGLMEKNQPSEEITKLLAAIDNGSIARVDIKSPGSGYAPGYGSPQVTFPPPAAGDSYDQATGRAVLTPNGKILRIDVVNRGLGYSKAPTVTVAPPAAIRFGNDDGEEEYARGAKAEAFIFRSGPNRGRIERIQLTDPGAGYTSNEIIKIRFSPPDAKATAGGVTASATAVLEYEVTAIKIYNNGTGYAVERPIPVTVEPPPLTARVNMNDPMMAQIIPGDEPLPMTAIPSKQMLAKMPNASDPTSVTQRAMAAAAKKKGCVGRACYDEAVVAVAYPVAERDSYSAFRTEDDMLGPLRMENAIVRGVESGELPPYVSAASSSASSMDSGLPDLPSFGAGISSSTELLSLLPAGVGLEYSTDDKRYKLLVDPAFSETISGSSYTTSGRAYDPDFGPRGRSPIERDMQLGVATYLRFVASGAICSSGVHLALTPIDGTYSVCVKKLESAT